jgi:hypothetical protein
LSGTSAPRVSRVPLAVAQAIVTSVTELRERQELAALLVARVGTARVLAPGRPAERLGLGSHQLLEHLRALGLCGELGRRRNALHSRVVSSWSTASTACARTNSSPAAPCAKVALEAFCEAYHLPTTHPEFNKWGDFRSWSRSHGRHSNIGYDAPKDVDGNQQGKIRVGKGDARTTTADMQVYTWEKAKTNTTKTLVDAAGAAIWTI